MRSASPKMQRAHFELIAEVLNAYVEAYEGERAVVDDLARQFADRLAQTNPQFNRARFLRACGVEVTL